MISRRSSPRRRWVGATVMSEIMSTSSIRPPPTLSRPGQLAYVATGVSGSARPGDPGPGAAQHVAVRADVLEPELASLVVEALLVEAPRDRLAPGDQPPVLGALLGVDVEGREGQARVLAHVTDSREVGSWGATLFPGCCPQARLGSAHGEGDRSRGRGRGTRGPRVQPGPGDLRGDRPDARGHQADGGASTSRRVERRADARAARPAHRPGALAERRARRHQAGDRAARTRTPTRSTRSGCRRARPTTSRRVRGHLPVGPHRRRDLPDRDRGARVVRADGHAHLPPLAGAPHRRRPPRRAAHRPRPAAGDDVPRRGAGRRRGPRAARGARLVGYPKTSGNRGVHVYVRIEPRWEFVDVRHAAIGFGRELERRDDGVTTEWWKEERGERIFVDFNQNYRDRTIASAYSLRPHPGRPGVHAADLGRAGRRSPTRASFNLFTVPDRLADGDPWAAIDDVAALPEPLLRLWESSAGRRDALPARLPEDAGRAAAGAAEQEGGGALGRRRQPDRGDMKDDEPDHRRRRAVWSAYLDFYRRPRRRRLGRCRTHELAAAGCRRAGRRSSCCRTACTWSSAGSCGSFLGEDVDDPWGDWDIDDPWRKRGDGRWQVPDDVDRRGAGGAAGGDRSRTARSSATHRPDELAASPSGRFDGDAAHAGVDLLPRAAGVRPARRAPRHRDRARGAVVVHGMQEALATRPGGAAPGR